MIIVKSTTDYFEIAGESGQVYKIWKEPFKCECKAREFAISCKHEEYIGARYCLNCLNNKRETDSTFCGKCRPKSTVESTSTVKMETL